MKSSLRAYSLRTLALSIRHAVKAAVRLLMKVIEGLHHGIMGCRMSALTRQRKGNERCLNKAS